MNSRSPLASRTPDSPAPTLSTPPTRTQSTPSGFLRVPLALLQRQCACGGAGGITGECTECRRKKLLQRRATDTTRPEAPSIVHDVLASSGRPLSPDSRAFFEPRFGHDFSRVRVHDDTHAAQSAAAVSALAYTVGRHVVSGVGQLDSPNPASRRLLAHELTHVVQQSAVPDDPSHSRSLAVGAPDTAMEAEAHHASAIAGADSSTATARANSPVLQRLGPSDLGQPPCALDAYRAEWRSVDLQPVFFKSTASDPNPTGTTWPNRFATSNTIWKKLGVTFRALSAVTLVDATNKTRGSTDAEANTIGALRSGSGIEVYFVDNDMSSAGGASTLSAADGSNVVISDRGTSDTLLAHELGHVLGLQHPPASDANTIMQPSNGHSAANPTRNTVANYNLITWPSPGGPTCIKPDA